MTRYSRDCMTDVVAVVHATRRARPGPLLSLQLSDGSLESHSTLYERPLLSRARLFREALTSSGPDIFSVYGLPGEFKNSRSLSHHNVEGALGMVIWKVSWVKRLSLNVHYALVPPFVAYTVITLLKAAMKSHFSEPATASKFSTPFNLCFRTAT